MVIMVMVNAMVTTTAVMVTATVAMVTTSVTKVTTTVAMETKAARGIWHGVWQRLRGGIRES